MCRNDAWKGLSKVLGRGALVALLGCLWAAGCDNSCFIFVSNPGGTTPITPPSCSFDNSTATLRLQFSSIATPEIRSGRARHILLSLRGIQAHPDANARDDSPGWVDLAPSLAIEPVQVDLMASAADSCAPGLLDENVVAGVYRRIRLRLVSNQQAAVGPVPRENACGDLGLHCIVAADGAARALVFDGDPPEVDIRSDRIPGGFLRILPDTHTTLALEFDPFSSTALRVGDGIRLLPIFTLDARPSCNSAAP